MNVPAFLASLCRVWPAESCILWSTHENIFDPRGSDIRGQTVNKEMGGACSAYGEEERRIQGFGGEP